MVSVFIEAHLIPLECYLEVEHVRVNLNHIHLRVVIPNSIACFCIFRKTIYKVLITTTLLCHVIQTLIIVDPQSNIPGLIIVPPVIRNVEGIELESWGGHLGLSSGHTIGTLWRPQSSYQVLYKRFINTINRLLSDMNWKSILSGIVPVFVILTGALLKYTWESATLEH